MRQGEEVVVASDPDHEEEAVMDGKLVLGINPYREICTLHLAGTVIRTRSETQTSTYFEAVKRFYFAVAQSNIPTLLYSPWEKF